MRRALLLVLPLLMACSEERPVEKKGPAVPREAFPGEVHLRNLRQLTFGGQNAEAYWSNDERRLVFQSTRDDLRSDQIFVMDDDGGNVRMLSTGKGRTTCAFFLPGDDRILYASTHHTGPDPRPTDRSQGYVWPVWSQYDLFTVALDGSDLRPLTTSPGYDAEATVSPRGDRIAFTSSRDGDLEIYTMAMDGSDVKRLTSTPGYDGAPVFSWDGKRIVWRAARPEGEELKKDKELLLKDLVRPSKLDLFVMDADGSNVERLTDNGAANWGPAWHPDGKRVIFCSNLEDGGSAHFDLYLLDVATKKTERVTHFTRNVEGARWSDDFDGFPMFTKDGKRLVFCSNRYQTKPHEMNVFVADWVP
jgi:Tol biopolymer transport system component